MQELFNESLSNCEFPDKLKLADNTPVFRKKNTLDKANYRPVSVLQTISKTYEKLLQKQITNYTENILYPYLCDCSKGYSIQHALMCLTEKILDKKGFCEAVLMDLSKAFDTINHELLIGKLNAYGFEKSALKLLLKYLSNRWQRTKINKKFSSWIELMQGVPQGSALRPLLFSIYLNDLFLLVESTAVSNFADGTTFFACGKDLNSLINRLEQNSLLAIEWFENSYMKLNQEICNLLIFGNKL